MLCFTPQMSATKLLSLNCISSVTGKNSNKQLIYGMAANKNRNLKEYVDEILGVGSENYESK